MLIFWVTPNIYWGKTESELAYLNKGSLHTVPWSQLRVVLENHVRVSATKHPTANGRVSVRSNQPKAIIPNSVTEWEQ